MPKKTTVQDFTSDQEVRWCPGCGDYAILKAMRQVLAEIGTPPEQVVCISGIGCAARLPYYLASFGLHTIHGRAPAIASGLAMARSDLDIWLVTGDGDGLSIGAGHMMHLVRRHHACRILLFNNAVYGLTKGQVSPTSPLAMVSPTTPFGNRSEAVNPCAFALGSGAAFVARSVDVRQSHLVETLLACDHASRTMQRPTFLEILQNCPVYHDRAQESPHVRGQEHRLLFLKEGEFLRFGDDQALVLDRKSLQLVAVRARNDAEAEEKGVIRHNPRMLMMAQLLAQLKDPLPLGVLYHREEAPIQQPTAARPDPAIVDLDALANLIRG